MEITVKEEKAATQLEVVLNKLIAEKEGIKPEDVTEEYILRQRETKIYPQARFNVTSQYGGYDLTGLHVSTRDEIVEREKKLDCIAESFGVKRT